MKTILRKIPGVMALVMAFIMILPMGLGLAKADDYGTPYITPQKIIKAKEAIPGMELEYEMNVVVHNQVIMSPYFYLNTDDTPFEQVGEVENRTTYDGVATTTGEQKLAFKVKVDENAKKGSYSFKLVCEGISLLDNEAVTVTMDSPIRVRIMETLKPANVVFENVKQDGDASIGGKTNVTFDITNKGKVTAEDITIVVGTDDGFVKQFDKANLTVASLSEGKTKSFKLPFGISAYAKEGVSRVSLTVSYTSGDTKYESSDYVDVEIKAVNSEATSKKFTINDFTVTRQAKAGRTASIAFNLKNKFKDSVTDISITLPSMTEHGFIPEFTSKDLNFKEIAAKETKSVVLNYTLIESAAQGLKSIPVVVSYKDPNGNSGSATEYAYIEVIEGDGKNTTPKLIISDFETSDEILKAGSTFDFSFDIENTNKSVAAKNIKVTLSSTDNVFSVTEGSNSFYIESIAPGAVIHNLIPLKVKNDCTTKAYPLSIKFTYEYDGMPTVENQVAPGVEIEEVLNFQVQENSRPVVSNIIVGGWDGARVGELTTVSFEFYNMGKAVLSNVTAKVSSDALTPTGDMVYIGNVEAGNGQSYEVEVTPNYSGDVTGTLIITYEDSNGEPVELETEFTGTVEEVPTFDDFEGEMGVDDGMMDEMPVEEGNGISKKAIIIIIIVIAAAAVACGVIIKKRKTKKKNAEVLDDDEE